MAPLKILDVINAFLQASKVVPHHVRQDNDGGRVLKGRALRRGGDGSHA